MQKRPSATRVLFFVVLAAIAAVYLVGRLWLQRAAHPAATEAGLVPSAPLEPGPSK